MSQPLLEVKNLRKYFKTPKGMLHAVDDVTFTIEKGKTLGVVGESGCGKSTTGRAILRLIDGRRGAVRGPGCGEAVCGGDAKETYRHADHLPGPVLQLKPA